MLGHIDPKLCYPCFKRLCSFLWVNVILQERETNTKYLTPNQIFPGTFIQAQILVDIKPILISCLPCNS